MTLPPSELRAAAAALHVQTPMRQRDAAERLGVREGELVAAHVGSDGDMRAVRLRPDWRDLFNSFESLGEVMALTRNASCVHEKTGVYRNVSCTDGGGLVLDRQIDLRLFFGRWAQGFAVSEAGAEGPRRSLQFFDAQGVAVHKIHARPATDLAAWAALVERFASADQSPGMQIADAPAPQTERGDAEVDVAAFRDAWGSLRDTHQFFGLLRRHGLTRTQALRLADPRMAVPVEPGALPRALDEAARGGLSIMVFVGNPGIIQIHTGPVRRVQPMGPWINVLDPGFNLHLRQDHVARAWVVCKPTTDGIVTSLELFDAQGETIAMLFGERKPGQPERRDWQALMDRIADEEALCAA